MNDSSCDSCTFDSSYQGASYDNGYCLWRIESTGFKCVECHCKDGYICVEPASVAEEGVEGSIEASPCELDYVGNLQKIKSLSDASKAILEVMKSDNRLGRFVEKDLLRAMDRCNERVAVLTAILSEGQPASPEGAPRK